MGFDRATVLPCCRHLTGEANDLRAVGGDAVAVESRGGEPSLTQMQRIFAGQQAVAEDASRPPQHDAANMVLRVAREDVGDGLRVIELELAEAVRREKADGVAEARRVGFEERR